MPFDLFKCCPEFPNQKLLIPHLTRTTMGLKSPRTYGLPLSSPRIIVRRLFYRVQISHELTDYR